MEKDEKSKLTPMLQQYYEIKNKNKDCIIFFRLGDFYEMFNEDAKIASKVLGLTLTRKPAGKGNFIPLAGIPYHSYENHIYKLIKKGYKVAICEQLEDPKKAKGIVKRGIIRIITPGTALSENVLKEKDYNFLCSFEVTKDFRVGISMLDLSTGKFLTSEFSDSANFEKLETEINKFSPNEFIIKENLLKKFPKIKLILKSNQEVRVNEIEDWKFDLDINSNILKEILGVSSLDGFGLKNKNIAIICSGAIIKYIEETQMVIPSHINKINFYNIEDFLIIDSDTQRNLELTRTMRDSSSEYSLLWAIDKTLLNSGSRLLKDWILNPLVDKNKIILRQNGVKEFYKKIILRNEIRTALKEIYDIERILSKISCKTVTPKDLISLKLSLIQLPNIKTLLSETECELLKKIYENFDVCRDIYELIEKSISDNPPTIISEGGIIKKNYNEEIDELRKIKFEGKDYLLKLEEQEKIRTGIQSLKIKFNRIFGYYIEITKANLEKTPENYIRKQTLVNSERFITPELKDYEAKVLNAEEKLNVLEEELFNEIREKINGQIERLQKTGYQLSVIDVISGLAYVALTNNYICPEITGNSEIKILNSRHPVIELISITEKFVENDININNKEDMLQIITGPNMAGKSTYIRQAALLVLMAQMGSFIPAKEASIGLVDRIFTRVGASDNLVRGQSTFMVEMIETANILNNATSKSLIILDEIGRGTSTFDGISLAWAISEFIAQKIKAKTMFATHYHELIELCNYMDGVKNYNIAVKEWNDKVIFLRKIITGGASKSYGIQVARLAGLPNKVIERSKEILVNLESRNMANPVDDMPLFNLGASVNINQDNLSIKLSEEDEYAIKNYNEIKEKLKGFDINNTTPMECMTFLNNLISSI